MFDEAEQVLVQIFIPPIMFLTFFSQLFESYLLIFSIEKENWSKQIFPSVCQLKKKNQQATALSNNCLKNVRNIIDGQKNWSM